ncbi:MAG: arginine repressor [Planctomycetota bacterium]|jgi:transcriptional regulator of arginine metabolism|nr:arginine repressor [Planctomycetota bacterium]MDP6519646.1 arginine repressor [Planctomycetota bacterium]MDP6838391.1 arginine repressor [Planctomycetota bacterium]MDP6955139.1 arginine repressor [Planctomycetota bacterium]
MAITTASRRAAVRALILDEEVPSQQELQCLLAERGVSATQSALSRDLRVLGAVKREGSYTFLGEELVTPLEKLAVLLRGVALAGDHMVVVTCEPGAASAVARALEAEEPAGLVGTVAGDDTFFAATDGRGTSRALERRLAELL